MQVCTLGRPSTTARQSKQAPIMQYGPARGAADRRLPRHRDAAGEQGRRDAVARACDDGAALEIHRRAYRSLAVCACQVV